MVGNIIKNDWMDLLSEEFEKEYYTNLRRFLLKEYNTKTVYPEMNDIYNALNYTSFEDTKVLILGQDPYHGPGQANGLAFSVKEDVKIPPSLRNIYKELNSDLGIKIPNHGNLEAWTKEGVLLLNTVFTVRESEANSHKNMGWEILSDKIIEILNKKQEPVVFILWGNNAISKEGLIDNPIHHIIKSYHPSPLSASRGFFGTKPFSKTNEFLKSQGLDEIDWKIKDI